MKKIFIIIFILLLTNCESSSELFVENPIASRPIPKNQFQSNETSDQKIAADVKSGEVIAQKTQDVFNAKNIETAYFNKNKIKVALFLPMSGKNRDLGQALYNSAILSLFDNDLNHNLELFVFDSKDTPSDASQTFMQIINSDIKIVIGPVYSTMVEAIKKNVLRNEMQIIALSNNQELSGNINNSSAVFVAGISPEQQIDKIVSYAIDQNKGNFAVMSPSNSYGISMAKLLKNTVESRDGRVIKSELYATSSDQDLRKSVKKIIESFTVPSKLAEGGGNKLDKNFRIKESDKIFVDVVLVPESGKTLSKITSLFREMQIAERPIKVAGIGQLDDVAFLNDKNYKDLLFAAPNHQRFEKFEKGYFQIYNKFPPRISSIAYDSVAAIAQISNKAKDNKITLKDFLEYRNDEKLGFDGIDGRFRFLKNGLVQRNLAILSISENDFEQLEEPTQIFLDY